MSWGLAALSGLLGGLPGLPKGMNEGMQFDQRQQQIDLQRRQFEEGRTTDTSSIGIPGRTPNALIPYLANLAKTKEETARKATLGQGLADQVLAAGTTTGMAPGASVEMPQPGALMTPAASGPMPAMTQKRVDPNMAALAKFLPQLAQIDPSGAAGLVKDRLAPQKHQIVGENARGTLGPDGKLVPFPAEPASAVPPFTPPPGYQPVPTVDKKGQVSTRFEPPPENRQRAEGALADMGWTPDMKGYREALHIAMYPPVPYNDGGGAVPRTFAIPRPPGAITPATPPATGPPGNTPTQAPAGPTRMPGGGFQSPPKAPSAAQQDDIASVDAAISGIQRLKQGILDPENQKILGTPLKNLEGYKNRVQDYWLGTGLKDTQREFLATTAKEMQTLKKELIGASRTVPELKDLIPLIPDPYQDNAGQFTAKIRAMEAGLDDIRRSKENAMRGSRVQPPPRLAPPDAPASAPKSETLSRRDARYQQLRQRGLTDQQIQQQFKVTVTD